MSEEAIQEKALIEPIKFFQIKKKKIIYFKVFQKRYCFWQAATENLFQNKKPVTPENLGLHFGTMKCHGPIAYFVIFNHYTLLVSPVYVKIASA